MTTWLVDKSALVRLTASPDVQLWLERLARGLLHVCTVTLLEVGFSARSVHQLRDESRRPPLSLMPVEYLAPAMELRAVAVQLLLAEGRHHRAPGIGDLLIASVAEQAGHTVLHVDKDFDLIAGVTHQAVERLRLE